MISVIVCSREPEACLLLEKNIAETIGLPHEFIRIANDGSFGICEAYNKGAIQSKFEYLCFVHEDVKFNTKNWGKAVVSALSQPETGLLGVIGNTIKTKAPSPWWLHNNEYVRGFIINKKQTEYERLHFNPLREKISEVKVIDGVFMCCRKEVWLLNKFDSSTFPGFHFYDLDFSLSISRKLKVFVSYNIELEHNSTGNYNSEWINNAINFTKKWSEILPVYTSKQSKSKASSCENEALIIFLTFAIYNRTKKGILFKYFFIKCMTKFFDKNNFNLIKLYFKS